MSFVRRKCGLTPRPAPQLHRQSAPTIVETKRGSCHCGAVQFEVDLEHGFEKLRRCNCSLCRRKGAVMASVALSRLRITAGQDKLSLYQWNTRPGEALLLQRLRYLRSPSAPQRAGGIWIQCCVH
jgi:hypothetical protein